MKPDDVQMFEKLHSQIEALHSEIGALSKKTPNDALNMFKLTLINGLIRETNSLLTGDYKPLHGFEAFSEDDIPTNSDVTMVLAQYLNCLEKLRADNIQQNEMKGIWYWIINGRLSDIRTAPPHKLREK